MILNKKTRGFSTNIPSLVPLAKITMTGLQASVVKPFSVVTTAAAFSKKCAVVARCWVVVTWASAWTSTAASTSDSATGRAKAREETERRRGIENLILKVRIFLTGG